MLFTKVLLFFAATTVSALAHTKRATPAAVLGDFKAVDSDVKNLTTTIKAWDGTVSGSVPILRGIQTLDKDLNKTTADLGASPVFSCTDSAALANYLSATIVPDVRTLLNTFMSRKTDFVRDGEGPTIKNQLQRLKASFDRFLAALLAKTCSAQQSSVRSSTTTIDNAFNAAIAYFS